MLFAPNDGLRQLAHGRWPCLFLFFGDPLDDEWCRGGDGAGVTGFDGGDGESSDSACWTGRMWLG